MQGGGAADGTSIGDSILGKTVGNKQKAAAPSQLQLDWQVRGLLQNARRIRNWLIEQRNNLLANYSESEPTTVSGGGSSARTTPSHRDGSGHGEDEEMGPSGEQRVVHAAKVASGGGAAVATRSKEPCDVIAVLLRLSDRLVRMCRAELGQFPQTEERKAKAKAKAKAARGRTGGRDRDNAAAGLGAESARKDTEAGAGTALSASTPNRRLHRHRRRKPKQRCMRTLLSGVKVLQPFSRGGLGKLVLGRNRKDGQVVALKVMKLKDVKG